MKNKARRSFWVLSFIAYFYYFAVILSIIVVGANTQLLKLDDK